MAKIAVALVHGMGKQDETYGDGFRDAVCRRFARATGTDAADALEFASAHWAPVLEGPENLLADRMAEAGRLDWPAMRDFMIHFLADVVAYQIIPGSREVYDAVHAKLAIALRELAERAGPEAPLCVVAHSLGTVIASNFLYDLQARERKPELIGESVRAEMGDTPLEHGETLIRLYTMASPIALFSLRYKDFGAPIQMTGGARWVNLYDRDDVIAWPLRTLNKAYEAQVSEDRPINVGNLLRSWNPSCHSTYWKDSSAQSAVAEGLAEVWHERARTEAAS